MTWRAKGRPLVAGTARGVALVLDEPLSLWGGLDPHRGEITDRRHPQSGAKVTDRVLVLPAGRGSSSASSILLEAVREKTAPAAIVLREIDPILALGAAVAREMYDRAPTVVVLGPSDYDHVQDGARVEIGEDGSVIVVEPTH